jgi:hypothetical protein
MVRQNRKNSCIQSISEVRAFDMFQSLNATGTPLTAIETFKPLVVNSANSKGQKFKNSNFDTYFKQIESLMQNLRSASSKNQRTNEYLTLFPSTYDGKKLTKQFSAQRKWLIDKYNECSCLQDKEEFIHQMGDIATYSKEIIYSSKSLRDSLPDWSEVDESERKLASFCLLYLKDANHRMSHTILSRFYAMSMREKAGETNAKLNFVKACQVVAAFFTLWRSALSTTGLDEIYRKLLQEKMSWKKGNEQLNLAVLKQYFKETLESKGIGRQSDWKSKAINDLRYDKISKVCRFVLFVTSHDTIPDSTEPGLMKIGKLGSCPFYLEPSKWSSDELKSVEHIAPQNPSTDWDAALYDNDLYEQIGNLTLLPIDINSSASNKNWIEKLIYYRHLAETDPDKLENLQKEAENQGLSLHSKTIELLKKVSTKHHILSIVELGIKNKWDKTVVEKRTERICDILWEKMNTWLD